MADARCPLACILSTAWQRCLPDATFIEFDTVSPTDVLAAFESLRPSDLVILIQSASFILGLFLLYFIVKFAVRLYKRLQ